VNRCALILLAACSSGAPRSAEDHAGSAAPPKTVAPPAPVGPYRAEAGAFAKGDVQVRVEWPNVPIAARASPGRTACGTASAAAVAPTTTWGIPDAFVAIDVDRGKPLAEPTARVVLADCALSPRAIVAGASLVVASEVDQPASLAIARAGSARPLAPADGSGALPVQLSIDLPIAGHAVAVPLAADAIYTLAGSDVQPAWIIAASQPYVAVTEASGQVVVRDVPVGTFQVEALLPARAGQPARLGHASVTVAANALADVTVELAPPP
jgi:hypothetical protein